MYDALQCLLGCLSPRVGDTRSENSLFLKSANKHLFEMEESGHVKWLPCRLLSLVLLMTWPTEKVWEFLIKFTEKAEGGMLVRTHNIHCHITYHIIYVQKVFWHGASSKNISRSAKPHDVIVLPYTCTRVQIAHARDVHALLLAVRGKMAADFLLMFVKLPEHCAYFLQTLVDRSLKK